MKLTSENLPVLKTIYLSMLERRKQKTNTKEIRETIDKVTKLFDKQIAAQLELEFNRACLANYEDIVPAYANEIDEIMWPGIDTPRVCTV